MVVQSSAVSGTAQVNVAATIAFASVTIAISVVLVLLSVYRNSSSNSRNRNSSLASTLAIVAGSLSALQASCFLISFLPLEMVRSMQQFLDNSLSGGNSSPVSLLDFASPTGNGNGSFFPIGTLLSLIYAGAEAFMRRTEARDREAMAQLDAKLPEIAELKQRLSRVKAKDIALSS